MTKLDPNPIPLEEAFEDDEWNARRMELEAKVLGAAKALLDFSQGAAGIKLPCEEHGFVVVLLRRPYEGV